MKYDFLDWAGVQELWAKIKNAFVGKDSSGNVTVTGKATVKDGMDVVGDSIFRNDIILQGGNVEIKDGQVLTLHSETDSKSVSMWCADDGALVVGGKTVATQADVTTAVANAGHLKREKVDALPGIATAKENVIYMVPNSTTGNNKFDEYMLIDGGWEKTGSSDIDLTGYSTTEEMHTAISTAIENSHTTITKEQINSLS